MADNVNIIVQDTINDIVVNAAVVVETIDINVQAAVDVVDIVANPNNYVVNINRIIGEQVQSDWTQTDNQAPDYIKNKPTIPAAQVNSDWNATTGVAQILNKPTLAAVATSGSYNDLSNKPTIPAAVTKTSDLTNDGADGVHPFITAADVTAQVNSDWNATSGIAEILNKPTIPTNTSDLVNDGENGVDPFITAADVPNFTSVVKHIVKNNGLSGTITKGTAVYVTSSNGTNMLVGRASNTSEATSSKTMGLMQSDITTTGANQIGFVITEGLLDGLNTASATAGDPVWLGVNGALIYGLTNKPYAPAHLVFIGIVTKVSAGNGEIFVKVQNGFELKEIHDVDLITTTPINGHLLGFDGTLWVNKTIATWLGFTPENVANKSTSTSLGTSDTLYPTQNAVKVYADTKFTLPALTSGSVLFSNGTTITQDNSNLFWDDTNNRLGIGTTTPTVSLDISGLGKLTANSGSYNPVLQVENTGSASAANKNVAMFIGNRGNSSNIDDNTNIGIWQKNNTVNNYGVVNFFNSSWALSSFIGCQFVSHTGTGAGNLILGTVNAGVATEKMRIFANGNCAINTTTDGGYKLDVNGTARVSGNTAINSGSEFFSLGQVGRKPFRLFTSNGDKGCLRLERDGVINVNLSSDSAQFGASYISNTSFLVGTTTDVASSQLTVESTTKGFLPPRMTTTQKNAIATPAAGLVVYDTTLGKLCVRTAAVWETITSI